MGILANYKCTNCSGYFKNQSIEITNGFSSSKQSCICNDCTYVFLISGITETNFDLIKADHECSFCKSKNFVIWDGTCPSCKSPTRVSSLGDLWD